MTNQPPERPRSLLFLISLCFILGVWGCACQPMNLFNLLDPQENMEMIQLQRVEIIRAHPILYAWNLMLSLMRIGFGFLFFLCARGMLMSKHWAIRLFIAINLFEAVAILIGAMIDHVYLNPDLLPLLSEQLELKVSNYGMLNLLTTACYGCCGLLFPGSMIFVATLPSVQDYMKKFAPDEKESAEDASGSEVGLKLVSDSYDESEESTDPNLK